MTLALEYFFLLRYQKASSFLWFETRETREKYKQTNNIIRDSLKEDEDEEEEWLSWVEMKREMYPKKSEINWRRNERTDELSDVMNVVACN
jgi:hypothetical protein